MSPTHEVAGQPGETWQLVLEASPQAIPEGLAKFDQVPPETADLQVTIVTFRK